MISSSAILLEHGRRITRALSPVKRTLVLERFAIYRVEGLTMPVDREAVLREARQFIVQHCTVEELQLGLTPEQLFGAMTAEEILVTVPPEQISESLTGEQIAVWLMLQQNLRGVPLEQSAARLPRQGRDKLRLYLDATPPPDPQPRA